MFVAIDAETKLVPHFDVGKRNMVTAYRFMNTLKQRLTGRFQLTTDGFVPERQNLTVRMACRRFTRLTNAFSKKLDNLKAAMALHFAWYNLVRIHRSLRMTPAMAAGVTDRVWEITELLA